MANTLIVYATKKGQTEKIARRIAETLVADGYFAKLVDVAHADGPLDLAQFEFVVIGAPIYAGGYPRSVVRFAREHRQFLEGVAPTTNPGWTPLFSRVAGIVTDTGSVIAHASLLAREYAVPAVVGTGDVTQRLRDGQVVTVDGNVGIVELLP